MEPVLNRAQRRAVSEYTRNTLVIAGPGSGKTATIVEKVKRLLLQSTGPYRVLVLTFSDEARKNLQLRIQSAIPDRVERAIISTFHAFGARLLRNYSCCLPFTLPPNFQVATWDERVHYVSEAMDIQGGWNGNPENILRWIMRQKYDGYFFWDIRGGRWRRIYAAYQRQLLRNGQVDFEDMVLYALLLLSRSPSIQLMYGSAITHIVVDEFQDTNLCQYKLLKKLWEWGNPPTTVVADNDQQIYRWRGADATVVERFVRDFGAEVISLDVSYRCPPNVLRLAQQVLANPNSPPLKSERPDGAVIVYEAPILEREADWIARQIQALLKKRVRPGQIAVIGKQHAVLRTISERMTAVQVPHRLVSNDRYDLRDEIMLSEAAISFVCDHGSKDSRIELLQHSERFWATSNNSDRYIAMIQPLMKMEFDEDTDAWGAICEVLRVLEVEDWLRQAPADDRERSQRLANWQAYVTVLKERYAGNTVGNLRRDYVKEGSVILLTAHACKGLEFKHVFVACATDDLYPYPWIHEKSEIEEERNVLYVALTRTSGNLYISWCLNRLGAETEVTRFLSETAEWRQIMGNGSW